METIRVINKVSHPIEWRAGMVVGQKKSGNACICVDMKSLNGDVLHETHTMPNVDDTLVQLSWRKNLLKTRHQQWVLEDITWHPATNILQP